MSDLSIVCVTRALPYARPFLEDLAKFAEVLEAQLVFGVHGGDETTTRIDSLWARCEKVHVQGEFLEQMLDPVIDACRTSYILRVDDDERCSAPLQKWLLEGRYRRRENWHFPRVHLWPDVNHAIATWPFYPDFQCRLSTKEKAKRPAVLHAAPTHASYSAGVPIEHHCFLAKSYEERRLIELKYRTLTTGTYPPEGVRYPVFPEDAADVQVRSYP